MHCAAHSMGMDNMPCFGPWLGESDEKALIQGWGQDGKQIS